MRRLMILAAALAGLAAGPALGDTLAEVKSGNAAFGEGRYDAAVEAYTKAILAGDLQPEALAVTFNNRGVAYSELGDYDRAIADYSQALSLKPGDKTSIKNLRIGYSRRGAAHANLGENDQALADYAKAIETDPQNAQTYVRRAQLYLDRGDTRAAVADLNRARELDPNSKEAAQILAKVDQGQIVATAPPPEGMSAATGEPAAPAAVMPAPPASQQGAGQQAAAQPVSGEPAVQAGTPAPADTAAAQRPRPPVNVTPGPARRFRVVQSVNYREGPGNDYPRGGSLSPGAVVDVVATTRGWMMIRLQGGKEGFVYQRYLEPAGE